MSHTPGPWSWVDECPIGRSPYIAILAAASESWSVAKICGPIGDAEIANARLIAAAPDLLAALDGLISLRDKTEITHEAAYDAMFKSVGRAHWDAALAALAKAKGEGR